MGGWFGGLTKNASCLLTFEMETALDGWVGG